jgi:NMD protein affecting ribosome stability and mRNA decay
MEENIYVLCNKCQKSIKPNKIQISDYLIVDLCSDCEKPYLNKKWN